MSKVTKHTTTLTQNQRKELVRILNADFGDGPTYKLEDIATMNDRQLSLAWQLMCAYITKDEYDREFNQCIGPELFPKSKG